LDELEDESLDEPLLELVEPVDVDVDVGDFEAANAWPAPTPPMTAAEASRLARTARRIFGAIVHHLLSLRSFTWAEQTTRGWESPVRGPRERPESVRAVP
jgi:hypothetical protein